MELLEVIKPFVKKILTNPESHDWELKGIGLIRTYLTKDLKLHVWDSRFKYPNVSMIHEHPWSFESLIVAGRLIQYRYKRYEHKNSIETLFAKDCLYSTVECGPGGCLTTDSKPCYLGSQLRECYHEGQIYTQKNDEIHHSLPEDGTVTLVKRLDYQPQRAANVYWEQGSQWVSAEPRVPDRREVAEICYTALERWFGFD